MNRTKRLIVLGGHAPALPYTLNALTLSDGGLPSGWTGASWAISSNKIVNTPTLGENLLTDPGLEDTYTGGLCATLTKGGSPTVADGAPDVHGGSHAQAFTAAAGNDRVNYPTYNSTQGIWYQYSQWVKRTAGTNDKLHVELYGLAGLLPTNSNYGQEINVASWTQFKIAAVPNLAGLLFCYPAIDRGSSGFCSAIVDDGRLSAITDASTYAVKNFGTANVIIKARPSAGWVDQTPFGIMLRANGPVVSDAIYVSFRRYTEFPTYAFISIMKRVGNVYTLPQAEQYVLLVANADLEVRANASTVSVYYNNSQVGSDVTITGLGSNTYHGIWSTGGNTLTRFFASAN